MTTFYNNSTNVTSDSMTWLLQFSLWPIRIVCPLLIVLCPIANWICISIFQSPIYHRSSSKWYFIFIAIFDTIYVLVTAPLIFLITFQIYIMNINIISCKLIVFLNYLSCQISAGLLACLSIDRLLATTCLYLYRYSCTTNISKYVCICVILMLSLINSHYLIGYTIDNGFCTKKHYIWYDRIYSYLNVVYLLSYSIIPFTIIAICNVFIVISVCQNKSNLKKKYSIKKPMKIINNPNEQTIINSPPCYSPSTYEKQEDKHQVFVTINHNQIINEIHDSDHKCRNYRSENLSLDREETLNPVDQLPSLLNQPIHHKRTFSHRFLSSSPTHSQKLCIQLQITISLLAISISFIFCTLPNCISTIMIQTYNDNDQVRNFWQAMNYFSIVPLLITHSVNLIFYYLSSNMFRNRFKEDYLRETNTTKQFALKTFLKT
ncbi:hypothetical protein I4U23_026481 [Adineta vaga]|nr:hypothetical protein I4U23_026481 [Adineta vaga]